MTTLSFRLGVSYERVMARYDDKKRLLLL